MTYRDPKTGRWASASTEPKSHLVFVYGTLKQGYGNWARLLRNRSNFLFKARTTHMFTMVSAGAPMVFRTTVSGATAPVRGEVYQVDSEVLRSLDYLEGYHGPGQQNHYDRITVQYVSADGTEVGDALMYVASGRYEPHPDRCTRPDHEGLLTWQPPEWYTRDHHQGEQIDG